MVGALARTPPNATKSAVHSFKHNQTQHSGGCIRSNETLKRRAYQTHQTPNAIQTPFECHSNTD
eukprot:4854856-Lingulodinium_polyedra.AAC.1